MKNNTLVAFAVGILTLQLAFSQPSIPSVPSTPRMVNDFAGVMGSDELASLEQKLRTYRDTTSNEIAIVIVPSLGGYDIESYSIELARSWGIGKKDRNNGILMLFSVGDRKSRIEVGYGLEGRIPDMVASKILKDHIQPNFRQGNYYQGLNQATSAIIKYASGEYKGIPQNQKPVGNGFVFLIIIIIILIFSVLQRFSRFRNRHYSSGGGFWAFLSLLSMFGDGGGRRGGGGFGGGSGGGFGGFGGGGFGGGGSSGDW